VGATLYAAACVAARTAARPPGTAADPAATERALTLLQQAFARGYGRERAAQDPDLAVIRDHPKFRRLMGSADPVVQPSNGR
jgi:hypothetical protein